MKIFLKERSKILLVVAIISLIIFILCIPSLLEFSKYISYTLEPIDEEVKTKVLENSYLLELLNESYVTLSFNQLDLMFCSLFIISSFMNVAGYLTKKTELNLISIGLLCVMICTDFYVNDALGNILLILFLLLLILGYIDQNRYNKKLK